MTSNSSTVEVRIPKKLAPGFARNYRYVVAYGGRGSGKTKSFALMSAVKAYQLSESGESGVILCAREFMNSLEDSSLEEVKSAILANEWLVPFFDIGDKYIRTKNRKISYIFTGLRHNLDSVKSKASIHVCWVDEAESVSETAWQKLLPTIREAGSSIWVTYNPEKEGSPVDVRFRKNPPDNSFVCEINWRDNPWFPDVLRREMEDDRRRLDDATFRWIWEGAYRENSEAQIFNGKYEVMDFEPESSWDGPYHGLDWGFASDPTAAIQCYINDDCLYITREASKVGLELDDTARYVTSKIPGIDQFVIRADSARPESISYVSRNGLPLIEAVPKWSGSVDDGIAYIRSFRRIYIHSRCRETLNEFRAYSYKVDRLSGDILPTIVDKYNHLIDALRYALNPMIQTRGGFFG